MKSFCCKNYVFPKKQNVKNLSILSSGEEKLRVFPIKKKTLLILVDFEQNIYIYIVSVSKPKKKKKFWSQSMAALELGGELSPLHSPSAGPLRRRGPDPRGPGAGAEGAPRRRARPGVFTVRVGPGEPLPRVRSTCSRSPATRRDHGGTTEGPRRGRGSRRRESRPRSRGPPRPRPPPPERLRPRSRAAGVGRRAAAREQTMSEGATRGEEGAGGRPPPPLHPSPAPSSPRGPAPLPAPVPATAPRSGRRGRGPRASPATPPQITKLPPTPPTKLRSHRAAPGAPPRAQPEQLRTFAAEKDNRQSLTRRRRRLEAAAAEATSGHSGLSGAQELHRGCSGSALALHTAPARPRMRHKPLGHGRGTWGGR